MSVILFVDDNRNIREFCRQQLEEEGYNVVAAADGEEALQVIDWLRPDLVILDICMPGVDGLSTVQRLRDRAPDLPVIFFTSFDDACLRHARAGHASACVEKSDDLAELERVVAATLASHRGRPWPLGLPPTESLDSPLD